jgi:hypothetical protein
MISMTISMAMSLARRFLRRPAADRWLLVRALVLHACVATLLRIVRFGRLSEWLRHGDGHPSASDEQPDSAAIDRIVWAVRQAASVVPWGRTCLTEALTAAALLRRAGCVTTLRYGVVTDSEHRVAAHAWLERDGIVILGRSALPYAPLESAAGVA